MARTTNKKAEMPEGIIVDNITATPEEEQQLNLEQQITVTNIAGWVVGFARLMGIGDVNIPPRGSVRLTINEVISQVQNGNKLLAGIDGFGNHATVIIEDSRVLRELGFENADIFSDEVVRKLFGITSQSAFEEAVKDKIRTRAEKYAFMASVAKLGLNDYSKIRFAEEYTGYKLDRVRQDEDPRHH